MYVVSFWRLQVSSDLEVACDISVKRVSGTSDLNAGKCERITTVYQVYHIYIQTHLFDIRFQMWEAQGSNHVLSSEISGATM